MKRRTLLLFTATLLAMTLGGCGKQEEAKVDRAAVDVKAKAEADAKMAAAAAKELEAREAAIDAYIYAYPLVTMERTRESLTADGTGRPNAFTHARYLPTATSGVNVVAPSRDTVYSSAWLDLRDGPMLIEQPDMQDRFWLMPVLDQWTNVIADPGTRTVGNDPHTFLIAGPDWTGDAPAGVVEYRSPTRKSRPSRCPSIASSAR